MVFISCWNTMHITAARQLPIYAVLVIRHLNFRFRLEMLNRRNTIPTLGVGICFCLRHQTGQLPPHGFAKTGNRKFILRGFGGSQIQIFVYSSKSRRNLRSLAHFSKLFAEKFFILGYHHSPIRLSSLTEFNSCAHHPPSNFQTLFESIIL